MHRRDYLRWLGLTSLTAVTGCTAVARTGGSQAATDEPTLATEPDYGDWFDGVSNFRGTVDRRGRESVTVEVGARANLGAFGFEPAAVAVSPGTIVVWRWTGKGGGHNVVAEERAFDSGPLVEEDGFEFASRFDTPGRYRYVCAPHRAMGMRGAIAVLAGDPGT